MNEEGKTKAQLIDELRVLRQELACARNHISHDSSQKYDSFRAVADLSYDWENWFSPAGELVWVNPSVFRFTGYTVDECFTLPSFPLPVFDESDRLRATQVFAEAVQGHNGHEYEFRIRHRDGTLKWVVMIWQSLYGASGEKLGHRSTFRDITKQKQTEEALRCSEQKYRELVENANSIILRWKCDGTITFINEYGLAFFGYSNSELLGRHVIGSIVPDKESTGRDLNFIMTAVLKNPKAFEHNVNENMRSNGERVWIDWTNKVVLDDQGQIKEVLSIGIDITERMRAEDALAKSQEFTRKILDTSPTLIYIYDLIARRVMYANRDLLDFLGYSSEQIAAWGPSFFLKILCPADVALIEKHETLFTKVRDDEVLEIEYRVRHANGEWCWMRSRNVLFSRDESGAPRQILGSAEEITKQKMAAEALLESERRYRTLFENMLDGYVYWELLFEPDGATKDFVFRDTNAAFVTLTGLHDVIGRKLREVIPGIWETNRALCEAFSRVALTGRSERFEDFIVSLGIWISASLYSTKNGYLITVFDNITKRKVSEEALRASEIKFSKAFHSSPCAMSISSAATRRFLEINKAFEHSTGFSRDEIIGRTGQELGLWAEPTMVAGAHQLVTTEGTLQHFETICIQKTGERVTGSISAELIEFDGEQCILSVAEDVTNRKRAEDLLKHERDNLKTILTAMPDGVYIVNANYDIEYINPTLERDFGSSSESKCYAYLHGRSLPCPWCTNEEVFAGKSVHWEWVSEKTGRVYELFGTPLWNPDGTISKLEFFHDITEHKQAERALKATVELLRICSHADSQEELAHLLLVHFRQVTGCEAIGMRLRDGHDFPYYETRGFSEEFMLTENTLCARDADGNPLCDSAGNPVLDCLCGCILCGRCDASKPFFTERGSFWTPSTTELLATTREEERPPRMRNRCIKMGYESMALIPIRLRNEILGLLQFNDRRKEFFSEKDIELFENLADYIGVALTKLKAEGALRKSEEHYRLISENSGDIIWILSMATEHFTFISPAVQKMRGFTQEEALVRPLSEALTPEAYEGFKARTPQRIAAFEAGDASVRVQVREIDQMCKDGSVLKTEVVTTLLTDEHGKVVDLLGVTRDITARKWAEEALLREKAFTDAVLDSVPGLLYLYDSCGHLIRWNMNYETVTGYTNTELYHMNILDWYKGSEEDTANAIEAIAKVERDGYAAFEAHLRTKSGERIRFYFTGIRLAIGGEDYLVGVGIDVTERKRAEERLLESERLYYSLVETMPQSVFRRDQAGHHTFANRMFCTMLDKKVEEILGKTVFELYPEHVAPRYREEDLQVMETGKTLEKEEVYLGSDGATVYMHVVKTPLVDAEGAITGIQGLFWDITERKHLEENLRQSQKMEAIGTLAGGIAHDFNNILQSLLGFAYLAKKETSEGSLANSCLAEVLAAGERAQELIGRILAFSRKTEQELKPIRLQTIVREVLKLIRGTLPSTIEMRHRIDESCSPVMGDPARIHQIVMNLCTNAFHAMRETGGVLEVNVDPLLFDGRGKGALSSIPKGTYVKLTVSDTGCGMDEIVRSRIFEPYFTTKKSGEGTGLGLAVVHGIVKELHGGIQVQSKMGVGTSFEVLLPVCLMTEKPQLPLDTETTQELQGSERILLVDDEEQIVRMVSMSLRLYGYLVEVCGNGREALTLFCANPDRFDIIITDQTMPQLTGIQLAEDCLRIRPGIPILLCTGHSELVDEEKAKAAGIRELLRKPFMPQTLVVAIRRALDAGAGNIS